MTQPDGVVWTGFSGYGVGAGLEDAGYGYSTEEREDKLLKFSQNKCGKNTKSQLTCFVCVAMV